MAKRRKRVHQVSCSMDVLELTRAGSSIYLRISAKGHKLGELRLGRGSLMWKAKGKRGDNWQRFRWTRFAEIMDYYR